MDGAPSRGGDRIWRFHLFYLNEGRDLLSHVIENAPRRVSYYLGPTLRPGESTDLIRNRDPINRMAGRDRCLEALPPKTLSEFIAYARARPGKLNYASAGVGGISHLVSTLFVRRAGIDALHVPYKSAAPATNALLAGEVDMYFGGAPEMLQHRGSGRITILATSSAQRLANLPDTPTIAETYPGFEVTTWLGFVAPRGTPREIVDAMAQATREALALPEVAERLASLGVVPVGSTPEEFAAVLRKDRGLYAEAIRSAGIPLMEPSR